MDTAQPDGSASGSWAQSRPLGAAKGPPGPQKGRFLAKTDPFRGPRSSVEVSEGAQAHGMDAAHPAGPTSGSWAKNRPPRALRGPPGPPKVPFWPKTGLFGGPRSSIEVSEGAHAHGMDAAHLAGPTSGSWAKSRSPGALRGPLGPPKGPFEA